TTPCQTPVCFADLCCHFCDLRLKSVDELITIDCFLLSRQRVFYQKKTVTRNDKSMLYFCIVKKDRKDNERLCSHRF
ncbi:MAG: hypothetical protein II453_10530, partial [Alphaproteobacteria bacterium]|nr:hypothetical protein [Alphaproteobacteria bacterium]